jgi:starvation-inducible DNA-binding protein
MSYNPLDAGKRVKIVGLLNPLLATLADLSSQIHHAHWNVKGPDFYSKHKMFDELYSNVDEMLDSLGERITALGGFAEGTIRMAVVSSMIDELVMAVDSGSLLRDLLDKHALVSGKLTQLIETIDGMGDCTTANMLQEFQHTIDKNIYFLEAHVVS